MKRPDEIAWSKHPQWLMPKAGLKAFLAKREQSGDQLANILKIVVLSAASLYFLKDFLPF